MGVGDVKWEKYGRDFLAEIKAYCSKNGLTTRMDLAASSRARKARTRRGPDKRSTFEITLDLFRSGMSIEQIAREREMTLGTIEGHLAMFIPSGKVELTELVPESKIEPIRQAIALHGDQSLGLLKTELGDDYTYGEIKAVVASMQ